MWFVSLLCLSLIVCNISSLWCHFWFIKCKWCLPNLFFITRIPSFSSCLLYLQIISSTYAAYKSGFGFACLDPEPCRHPDPFTNRTTIAEGFISRALWVLAAHIITLWCENIKTVRTLFSGLAWKTWQIAHLACDRCQTPNLPLPHGIQWCLLCLAQKSLNLCPLQVGKFLDKIAGQRQRHDRGATSCELCCCCTARLLPCFFPPSTLPCPGRAWADTDTTETSTGKRDVAWKRDCLGQQETQAFGTHGSLGRSSEITSWKRQGCSGEKGLTSAASPCCILSSKICLRAVARGFCYDDN